MDEEFCAFLVATDFAECNSARTIVMRLLDTSCSRGTLTSRLCREELFPQCICEQFAWCEPCCLSNDTEVVITEVLKRLGVKRGMVERVQQKISG